MSYEGYIQHLCANGHRFDTAADYAFCEQEHKCSECGTLSVFQNDVDDTNGESVGVIADEDWERFKISEDVVEMCNLGHIHLMKAATYRIPTKEELEEVRSYWSYNDWTRNGEWKRLKDYK